MTSRKNKKKRLNDRLKDREKPLKCTAAKGFTVKCINAKKSNISDQCRPETLVRRAAVLYSFSSSGSLHSFNSAHVPFLSLSISTPRSSDPLSINARHCFFPSFSLPLSSLSLFSA